MGNKICGITRENWVACMAVSAIISIISSLSGTIYLWVYGDFNNMPNYTEPIWAGVSFGMAFIAVICGCALLLMSRKKAV